jgi:V8-like Glu-specific endopeptidase
MNLPISLDLEDKLELMIRSHKKTIKELVKNGPHRVDPKDIELYQLTAVGLVISYNKKTKKCIFGTGCIIDRNVVVTCAHNIYDAKNDEENYSLQFVPFRILELTTVRSRSFFRPTKV